MIAVSPMNVQRSMQRFLECALLLAGPALVAPRAHAGEIIPSLGMTRTPESGDDTHLSYGIAVRGNLAPMVAGEIGVGYRTDTMFNGDVESTQWPVTGSLWFKPMTSLYLGGGVGWYNTTLHYPSTTLLASSTTQEFGMHLGGGLTPLGGAHREPPAMLVALKKALTDVLRQVSEVTVDALLETREDRILAYGKFKEISAG